MVTGDNTDKIEVGLDMNKSKGEETSEETQGAMTDRIVVLYKVLSVYMNNW